MKLAHWRQREISLVHDSVSASNQNRSKPTENCKHSNFRSINSSGGSSRLEDAVECYQRAANLFKMAKNWSQAGKAFCEAANLHSKAGSRHDAATNYVDASNCYKKTEPHEAVNCLKQAIAIYTDMGRFTMAAKHHQTIAEMYENEANDLVCMEMSHARPHTCHCNVFVWSTRFDFWRFPFVFTATCGGALRAGCWIFQRRRIDQFSQ